MKSCYLRLQNAERKNGEEEKGEAENFSLLPPPRLSNRSDAPRVSCVGVCVCVRADINGWGSKEPSEVPQAFLQHEGIRALLVCCEVSDRRVKNVTRHF